MKLLRCRYVLAAALGLVALTSVPLAAQSLSADLVATANELYEGEDYSAAAQSYEQVVSQGVESSDIYYNLGNAYFKQGNLGQAVLNYLRAERLAPRDGDVRNNLDLARSQTLDKLDTGGDAILAVLGKLSRRWLTVSELAIISLLAWFLLGGGLAGWIWYRADRNKSIARYVAVFSAVAVIVAGSLLLGRVFADGKTEAVIVAESIDVVSGPGDQYVTEFTLHAGAEVRIVEARVTWTRLVLPGGELQGWVPTSAVMQVVSGHG